MALDENDRLRNGTIDPNAEAGTVPYDFGAHDDGSTTRLRVIDETWRGTLVTKLNKRGECVVVSNVSNVVALLRFHSEWAGVLAYDAFAERIVMRRPAPWHPGVAPANCEAGVLRESDTARIIDWLVRAEGLAVGPKIVEQAVPVVAEAEQFHPVREYLRGLEWDGVPRLPTWLSTYCGVEQSEYAAAIGTKWMISAVARPLEPGCQVDCMLILEGAQGIGKSKLFRSLVPDPGLYSETGVTIGDKDSYQALHGVWLYLLDELDSLKRGDVTRTKNFLTSPKDHYRPSYGRGARDFYRQCVFAGTTNESEYLSDATGNRRFWPVRVTRPIDIAAIVRDRDQLWAEAFERFGAGEHWYADTPELRRLCEEEQAERVPRDAWEDYVAAWLARPDQAGAVTKGILTSDVARGALSIEPGAVTKTVEMRIAEVLRALGFVRGPRHREGGARVRRYVKAGTAGTGAGDTPSAENIPAEAPLSPPSPPNKVTHTESGVEGKQEYELSDSGGDGGPVDSPTPFADWVESQGIGG